MPAWQSENERFTTARTVTDGFSAAKATICLFCIEPTRVVALTCDLTSTSGERL